MSTLSLSHMTRSAELYKVLKMHIIKSLDAIHTKVEA